MGADRDVLAFGHRDEEGDLVRKTVAMSGLRALHDHATTRDAVAELFEVFELRVDLRWVRTADRRSLLGSAWNPSPSRSE